jgi:membrane-associated phospholipid phosphatase
MLSYITVVLLAYVGFYMYPTILPRPQEVGDGFFAAALRQNYDLDPPYNCFPSLHVAWAFVSALTSYRVHRGVGLVALLWATIIGVSTLYTKQHYVVDVIAGVAIAYVAYLIFLRGYRRDVIPETDRRLAPKRALRALWLYIAIAAVCWMWYTLSVAIG